MVVRSSWLSVLVRLLACLWVVRKLCGEFVLRRGECNGAGVVQMLVGDCVVGEAQNK